MKFKLNSKSEFPPLSEDEIQGFFEDFQGRFSLNSRT
jgi:hypothetical protein